MAEHLAVKTVRSEGRSWPLDNGNGKRGRGGDKGKDTADSEYAMRPLDADKTPIVDLRGTSSFEQIWRKKQENTDELNGPRGRESEWHDWYDPPMALPASRLKRPLPLE